MYVGTSTPDTCLDGLVIVTERPEGAFVSVIPPLEGGRRVALAEALRCVEAYGISCYDRTALERAVREATGEETRISDPLPVEKGGEASGLAGEIVVSWSRDRMRALLTILPPLGAADAEPRRRLARILEALREAGVRYGVRREALRRLAESGEAVEGFVAAEGEPPEDGTDARIDFTFDPSPVFRPRERSDGSVDHREVLLIETVEAGDLLARLEPARPGRAGIRVDGVVVPHRPGVDRVRISPGAHVEEREGGRAFVATEKGHPVWDGRTLSVVPVYVVPGDVDGSTGNVRFGGDVLVKGWVRRGFVVEADGDVEILGGVEGGTVVSRTGTVWIHGGVRGGARVRAARDAAARFVEGSDVLALRDVVLADAALHAELSAGRAVLATEGRGLLLGGTTRAQETIRARVFGGWSETATETQVRIEHVRTREILAEILSLEERIRTAEGDSRRIRALLEAMPADVDRRQVRPRLARALEVLEANRETFLAEKQRRERLLGSIRGGEIVALQRIHPGVVVAIGSRAFTLEHRTGGCTFFRDGPEIRWL